jgi:hypothetical protein
MGLEVGEQVCVVNALQLTRSLAFLDPTPCSPSGRFGAAQENRDLFGSLPLSSKLGGVFFLGEGKGMGTTQVFPELLGRLDSRGLSFTR